MLLRSFLLAWPLFIIAPLSAQTSGVSPNAPHDHPVPLTEAQQVAKLDSAIQPYVTRARSTYPDAKQRFQAGLPAGEIFFVTTKLRDSTGHVEQVFVFVDSIVHDTIHGRIWNVPTVVRKYHLHQNYEFPESTLLDWLISKADGSEEGNFVGKFLDTYRP